jgi:hypothetical protein
VLLDEQHAVGVGSPPVFVHVTDCFREYLARQVVSPKALLKLMEGRPQ